MPKYAANYAPLTPITFLERTAAVFGDRTSIIYGDLRFTWAQTMERCRRLASQVSQLVSIGQTVNHPITLAIAAMLVHLEGVPKRDSLAGVHTVTELSCNLRGELRSPNGTSGSQLHQLTARCTNGVSAAQPQRDEAPVRGLPVPADCAGSAPDMVVISRRPSQKPSHYRHRRQLRSRKSRFQKLPPRACRVRGASRKRKPRIPYPVASRRLGDHLSQLHFRHHLSPQGRPLPPQVSQGSRK
jgi:hypothetical protein